MKKKEKLWMVSSNLQRIFDYLWRKFDAQQSIDFKIDSILYVHIVGRITKNVSKQER